MPNRDDEFRQLHPTPPNLEELARRASDAPDSGSSWTEDDLYDEEFIERFGEPPIRPLTKTRPRRFNPEVMQQYIDRPLIFVPGILGSQLYEGELSYLAPQHGPHSSEVVYEANPHKRVWPPIGTNPTNGKTELRDVRNLREPALVADGLFPGVYHVLINFITQQLGYTRGENFFKFPYDWTLSTSITGERLGRFIREVVSNFNYGENADKTVDVICHSMGGFLTRFATKFSQAPVARTIYLASPHFGATRAYLTLHKTPAGTLPDPLGFGFRRFFLNRAIGGALGPLVGEEDTRYRDFRRKMKEVVAELPSVYELLPDKYFFEQYNNSIVERDGEVFEGWKTTYIDNEVTRLNRRRPVHRAMGYKELLGRELPGRLNLVLYSSDEDTPARVRIAPIEAVWTPDRWEVLDSPGDGTVPRESARGAGIAVRTNGDHLGVPNAQITLYMISEFLVRSSSKWQE